MAISNIFYRAMHGNNPTRSLIATCCASGDKMLVSCHNKEDGKLSTRAIQLVVSTLHSSNKSCNREKTMTNGHAELHVVVYCTTDAHCSISSLLFPQQKLSLGSCSNVFYTINILIQLLLSIQLLCQIMKQYKDYDDCLNSPSYLQS